MFQSYRNQSVDLNQLTGFYMIGTLVFKGLNHDISCIDYKQRKVEDKSKYKMKI